MGDDQGTFDKAMREFVRRCQREAGFRPAEVASMLSHHSGVETARRLLAVPDAPSGFTRLCAMNRPDLTIERLVLSEPFSSLFDRAELETARNRFGVYGINTP